MLEITLTWVSGYRRSQKERQRTIYSLDHARSGSNLHSASHLHCLFDLAISTPFWIIAWIETIFMEFRGPKALVNLHGRRQARNGTLADNLRVEGLSGCGRGTGERGRLTSPGNGGTVPQ